MNESAIAFVCAISSTLSAIISWHCIRNWNWDLMTIAMACSGVSVVLIGFVVLYKFAPR